MSGRGGPGPGEEIRAAGALLYTYRAGQLQLALIHRPKRDDWTFPKGKVEPGEHVLAAAVREVTEETGIRPVLGAPLGTVHYRVDGRPKRVDYWAARVDPPAAAFVPNDEVDTLDWLSVPEATARLSYRHDIGLLERLVSVTADLSATASVSTPDPPMADPLVADPPLADTVVFILLRHASAGRKDAWAGDDLLRPLDAAGGADAGALANLLACYGPRRVISSAAERCLGTVRPYAERIGADIAAEPAFTVRGHGDTAEAARRCITELIADPEPKVVCAHRENLPVLLDHALAALGEQAGPARDWSPPKSGFWVLHVAGGALTALEHHDLDT